MVSRYVNMKGTRQNVLSLRPADEAPIADLYEPVLVGFSLLAFRIRGFERAEGLQGVCSPPGVALRVAVMHLLKSAILIRVNAARQKQLH